MHWLRVIVGVLAALGSVLAMRSLGEPHDERAGDGPASCWASQRGGSRQNRG
jgi:hypothetical protein